ncbi:hypothetical protein EC973_001747 [Apophysomyces ossiformis]|uniref:Enoyl reductase (ER) domain-containing protein n=1 Tax=Apophysomyces ossiformis TaxID=679940 RepID=A0A8H7BJ71_9FUNG|nr:hypothetical protein EC973_001747 [Apophysomyces ossiformis]
MSTTEISVPTTMQALQLASYGPAQTALKYVQVDTPKITEPTDVLVKIKAVGVNPVEGKLRAGNLWVASLNLPAILGADFSGVVVQRGEKVSDLLIGDEVYGSIRVPFNRGGTYAEYAVVSTTKDAIAKKPEHMSFEEAAAVGIAALTAFEGVVKQGKLSTDHPGKLLVAGASGGVGSYAVQIGKAVGASVVGICSGKNKEFVSSIGADRVVNYQSKEEMEVLAQEKGSYDVIFDCVGGDEYFNQLSPLLQSTGVYCSAVGPVQHLGAAKLSIRDLLTLGGKVGFRTLFGRQKYNVIVSLPRKDFQPKLHPLFDNKSVRSIILDGHIFDLKDGAKAHELLETHRTVGKIVLRV